MQGTEVLGRDLELQGTDVLSRFRIAMLRGAG